VSLRNPDYLQVDYQYDPAGRMLTRLMSSGAKSVHQYDAAGRLSYLGQYDAAGALIADSLYTRDRLGRVLSQTDLGAPTTYAYDALYRLTTADYPGTTNDELFTYDKVGNRKTHTKGSLTANANTRHYIHEVIWDSDIYTPTNRLAAIRIGSTGGTLESSFTFDDEGRMTAQTGPNAKTLTWDAKGRLKTLTKSGTAETYAYDPMDYRIGRSGGSLGNLDYYLEGEHLESTYQSGVLKEKYFRGSSTDELVAGYLTDTDGKTKPFLFHQDSLTSTTQVSGHNGGVIQSTTYGAFGNVLAATGSSPNRLKYTGREDDGTGCYYYRARYYCPDIGRFPSEDPLGFAAGDVNFYVYVGNDAVNANDPSGLVLQGVGLPTTGGRNQTFFFDSSIANNVVNFVRDAQGAGYGISVTSDFRSIKDQAEIYKQNTARGLPAAIPGTGYHETGFAVDVNVARAATFGKLDPIARVELENIALMNNLSPIDKSRSSGFFPGVKSGTAGTMDNSRVFDPVHFQANPLSYGYGSVAEARSENQADYQQLQGLTYGNSLLNNQGGAAGGFLLYPNKSNTNMMQSVYRK
ncbi:MAG: RHS repeat-associated core domain-containing protein, partial [Pseudomonadota bacterium]|nr:RHS repeat-associated core domain-containing protein [Pseudomonadota bacterium]